jgi:hypothetical protein
MKFCAIIKGECVKDRCIFFKSYRRTGAGVMKGQAVNSLAACVFLHDWINDIYKTRVGDAVAGESADKVWNEMEGTVEKIGF